MRQAAECRELSAIELVGARNGSHDVSDNARERRLHIQASRGAAPGGEGSQKYAQAHAATPIIVIVELKIFRVDPITTDALSQSDNGEWTMAK